MYGPRILVLAPTRELAMVGRQGGRHLRPPRAGPARGHGGGRRAVPAQIKALRGPLDILIATPGRLLDHLQTGGKAVLEHVEMLVLDEADRMLDMGFIDDITTIADHVPAARQTVMFSATFAGNVGGLARATCCASRSASTSPRTPTRTPTSNSACTGPTTPSTRMRCSTTSRPSASVEQAVIFTSTQRDADWLADRLADMGHAVASLHGGMPQGRRNRVLQACATSTCACSSPPTWRRAASTCRPSAT